MRTDSIRKIIAIIACLIIVTALIVAQRDDATSKPMLKNGDSVGMSSGETFEEYEQRIKDTTDREGVGFGLVTFSHRMNDDEAGAVLDGWTVQRVNALVFPDRRPVSLPEPVAPETRHDVIARVHHTDAEGWASISGAMVYGDLSDIREIVNDKQVVAVEVLPQDAAWDRFGIRPVRPS